MKNYIDGFYELIHKNSLKRRRMVSLLLVLSMFVSSGVLWGLRDTGITMVNEELCGLSEHTHTDECYEDVLICGLEENEEHTHTAECYERRLVCGMEEHIHNAVCLGAEETIDETADDDIFALGGSVEYIDENEGESEEILLTDLPDLTLDNEIELLATQEEQNAPYMNPGTKTTIDNIAEGIKFTLFDYGDSNLESQNNNYGFAQNWVQNENDDGYHSVLVYPYEHNDIATSGINTGRNPVDDIMFFAYGTPIPSGIQPSDDYVFYNYWTEENGQQVHKYMPDKNSYSGDYNSNPHYSGNRSTSGIVKADLGEDGYPVMNNAKGNSLAYLFAPTTNVTVDGENIDQSEYKTVYKDVNHLLQRNTQNGHLFFNSNDNYAYYDKDSGEFIVYDTTYPVINPDHHESGDTDFHHLDSNGEPTVYDSPKQEGFQIGFFPFDEYDPTRRDPNFNGNGYNHHFGMTMEAKFVNPSPENLENGEPVSFKYSGDDDMWVFVDGKRVLDIGGIHEPAGGMIDFTNGLVWMQDNELGNTMSEVQQQLHLSDAEWAKLPMPIGTDTTGTGNKWIVTPLTQYLGDDWDALVDGKKQTHEIKMFYLERGGCYSNLAMEMNLPTLKPLTVKKEVNYQDHLVKDTLIDDKEYEFQIWEWKNNEWIKPNLPGTDQGYFRIKDGRRMTFEDLEQNRQFRITEVNVDPNIYDQVSINGGTPTQLNPGGGNVDVNSSEDPVALSTTNSYIFNNRVIQETTKIKVKKDWVDPENKKPADFTMKYKIMRTDSATGEIKQIALRYEVTDPDTHETTIKKRRTFLLRPDEQLNGKTIDDLLARYGNHIYSYKVEELNVPMNFKASYSETTEIVDGKEISVLQVTNTDISKSDIFVRKEWENTPPEGQPPVKLVLRREMVGYHPSAKTNLKVNLIDEGKNPIASKTFNDVYANGSAEIICELPEGVILYRADEEYCPAVQKTPDQLVAKYEDDENILVVKNLAPLGNDPDAIANEVTLKLLTYNAEDELLLVHHSFTRNPDGWSVQNDPSKGTNAKVEPSGYNPYAKGDALSVYDRTKSFNGATLKLDPAKFKMNKTYTFSTYVYYDDADAPDNITFNFTFNDGLNKANNGSYSNISSKSVPKGQWTQLTGTIQLPDSIDPYNMFIIVETANPTNNSSASNYEAPLTSVFRMDEFTAVEGEAPVSIAANTGVVTVTPDRTVYNISFNDTVGAWTPRGASTVTLTSGHDTTNHFDFMVVDGRDDSWQGAQLSNSVLKLEKGHEYHFEGYVQGNGGSNISQVKLSVDTINKPEGSTGQYDNFKTIGTASVKDGDNTYNRALISGDFLVPDYADIDNMYIYYEGNENGRPFNPFRVHNLKITDITEPFTLEDKDGYSETSGNYVSDYSNYELDLDENSVTNPLHLANNGEYSLDTGFSKEITIPNGNMYDGMGYHWGKNDLGEDSSNFLYRYWIEEVKIGDKSIDTNVVLNGDEKTVVSEHNDYLISYDRQFVATNTENSPILVTNKYIWYKLPATGGRGTTGIYVLGAALTALGLFSGCAANRRRRRRD